MDKANPHPCLAGERSPHGENRTAKTDGAGSWWTDGG